MAPKHMISEAKRRSLVLPHLIFREDTQYFAILADKIHQIIMMPKWIPVPDSPRHLRGIIDLRKKVIPLIDMRMFIGLTSKRKNIADLVEMLDAREQDHVRWLQTLENCINDGTDFTLAGDPKQCAFGKWLSSYKPEQRALAFELDKIHKPHADIHAVANTTLDLVAAGQHDEARRIIEHARETILPKVLNIFASVKKTAVSSVREVALVINLGKDLIAISADSVEGVERIPADRFSDATGTVPALAASGLVKKVARVMGGTVVAYELELGRLAAAYNAIAEAPISQTNPHF